MTQDLDEAIMGRRESVLRRRAEALEKRELALVKKERSKAWKEEILPLWYAFVTGKEYAHLAQAMKDMREWNLQLKPGLEYDFADKDRPFIHVIVSGGYYSSRCETRHSPEGYFSSISKWSGSGGITAQESFQILLTQFDSAFEAQKNKFRYRHDPEYRTQVDAERRLKESRDNQRVLRNTGIVLSVIVAMIWFFFFR